MAFHRSAGALIIGLVTTLSGSGAAWAQQPESSVPCTEVGTNNAGEPLALAYGQSTSGCAIELTDLDRFSFEAMAGDKVVISLFSTQAGGLDPSLEVRGPGNVLIVNPPVSQCDGSSGGFSHPCSFRVRFPIANTGVHFVNLRDDADNEIGAYLLQIESVPPVAPPPHLDYDATLLDTIGIGTDTDFFELNADPGTQVRLNVFSTQSLGLDPSIRITDPNGDLVADGEVCDGSSGGFSHPCSFAFEWEPLISGTYLVELHDSGSNETGDYSLSLWCHSGPCSSDGVTTDPPPPIVAYDETETGEIDGTGTDGDFYQFYGVAGSLIRLNVLSSASLGLDPVVEVRNPFGTKLIDGIPDGAVCDGSSGGFSHPCSFSLEVSVAATGFHSISLFDSATNETGSYQLSLWCLVGACDSDGNGNPDATPRNGPPVATPLHPPLVSHVTPIVSQLDQGAVTPTPSQVSTPTDGDFFEFHGVAGSQIRLVVFSTGSTGLDPVVEVRDPSGTKLIDGISDGAVCDGSSGGFSHPCSFSAGTTVAVTGRHFIAVYDSATDETGAYQLALWCLFGPCDSDSDGVADGRPPILSFVGSSTEAAISPATDADAYVVKATAGTEFTIVVNSTESLGLDPVLEVRDSSGAVIVNGVAAGAFCDGSSGGFSHPCTFSVTLTPTTTETLEVALYDSATNETGAYTISLQCDFGTCTDPGPPPTQGDNCIEAINGTLMPDLGGNVQLDGDGDGIGNACDPDLNNDTTVDFLDLGLLKGCFFSSNTTCNLDGLGLVSFLDLGIMKAMFFKPPGPSGATPTLLVPASAEAEGGTSACGLGIELTLVLPTLVWLRRRGKQRER